MNDGCQIVFGDERQILRREKSFQQQDSLTVARIAQLDGVLYVQQRDTLSIFQCAGDAQQTVAVGIGLDHSHDAAGSLAARDTQIILKRG